MKGKRGLAAIFAISLPFAGVAEDSGKEKTPEQKAKSNFPPEIEKKLSEVVAKISEGKREVFAGQLKKEIGDVVKATGLGAEGSAALEAAAKEAVDHSLAEWTEKLAEMFRQNPGNQGTAEMATMLDQVLVQLSFYKDQEIVPKYVRPVEQSAWTEALKGALSPEQNAQWAKALEERDHDLKKQITEYLKPLIETMREQAQITLMGKADDAKLALDLTKERSAAVDELAKSLAKKNAETWGENAMKSLLLTDPAQRNARMRQGNFFPMNGGESIDPQMGWQEGLAMVLTREELAMLKAARAEKRKLRAAMMGRLLIAQFDAKVAFTAAQREQLLPIAERLVKEDENLVPEESSDDERDIGVQSLFAAGAKATPEELGKILDPLQCQHWKEAAGAEIAEEEDESPRKKQKPEDTKQPARPPEPEDFENALSDFLHAKTVAARKPVLATMLLEAEDAVRVGKLPPEAAARLQTAARGAAEGAIQQWRANAELSARSLVQGATAQNVKQRLAGLEDYQFGRAGVTEPESAPVWRETAKAALDEAQTASWGKEVAARAAFQEHTVDALLIGEFDRKFSLTPEQRAKLEPLVAAVVRDYSTDIERMFAGSRGAPWYFQSYSMFLPFAGVPEKDLKPLLGKEKWERWRASSENSNSQNYWENIQQLHKSRVNVNNK